MKPIETEDTNVVYAKDQPQYQPLPVHKDKESREGFVTSCWELSDEELEQIKSTKRIYLRQLTFHEDLQPVMLSTKNPVKQ